MDPSPFSPQPGRNLLNKRSQAVEAFRRGEFDRVLQLGRELTAMSPDDTEMVALVGMAASKAGNTALAERNLRAALGHDPDRTDWRFSLAEALFQAGRFDESIAEYDRVIAADPGEVLPIVGKAVVLEKRGDYEQVRALLEPVVERDGSGFAASTLALLHNHERDWRATVELLAPWIGRPQMDSRVRMSMCRTIARAYEGLDEIGPAFDAVVLSNRLMADKPYDPRRFESQIDRLIDAFAPDRLPQFARATSPTDLAVFVASMPRSGSTLCEQVIHAHPHGFGAGEISDFAELARSLPKRIGTIQPFPDCLRAWTTAHADAAQKRYLERLRGYDPDASRIANKHLGNYLELGLIWLVLPGAKVIHVRRDPMDNGFSIFMAAMNPAICPWSTDLAHIGHAFRQYRRLMDHWRSALDLDILEIRYEQFVAEPEDHIRRIISFLGLEWDDACLAFHEAERDVHTLSYDQVRQPIYSSAVERWRKYESHLGPLRDALGDTAD